MPPPTVNEDLKTVSARAGQEGEITTLVSADAVGIFRGAVGSMTVGWGSFLNFQNSIREATTDLKGLLSTALWDKLDAIEDSATADQTGAEIKSAYEGEADTNAFTDAEVTKLAGIATAATIDQTGAAIKSAYEGEADTNAFTDADEAKLDGLATAVTPTDKTAGFTAANADHGKTFRWTGTSDDRLIVPDGLTVGTAFDVVADAGLASLADLTIQRPHTDGIIRLGEPAGGRILRPGGQVRVRVESATKTRIEGDQDPATMDAGSGGATFLLERGRGLSASGGWEDQSAVGHHFNDTIVGAATVDALTGQMELALADGVSGYFRSTGATYAGDSLILGFSGRIDAMTGTGLYLLYATDWTPGYGINVQILSAGSIAFTAMTAAATQTTIATFTYLPGVPFAMAVAVFRHASTGSVYAFGSMSPGHEIAGVTTSLGFSADWTAGAVPYFELGLGSAAGKSLTADFFALQLNDNVSFVDGDDQADQSHAMLGKMRGYHV